MSTEIVRWINWHAQIQGLDPLLHRQVQELSNPNNPRPKSDGVDWIRKKLDELTEQMDKAPGPRRYKLPDHWHWMGDGKTDYYRPGGRRFWADPVRIPDYYTGNI